MSKSLLLCVGFYNCYVFVCNLLLIICYSFSTRCSVLTYILHCGRLHSGQLSATDVYFSVFGVRRGHWRKLPTRSCPRRTSWVGSTEFQFRSADCPRDNGIHAVFSILKLFPLSKSARESGRSRKLKVKLKVSRSNNCPLRTTSVADKFSNRKSLKIAFACVTVTGNIIRRTVCRTESANRTPNLSAADNCPPWQPPFCEE